MPSHNKGHFIQRAIKNKGAFTAEAKARGMTVDELTRRVRSNPDNYSLIMRRRANLANTLKKIRNKSGK